MIVPSGVCLQFLKKTDTRTEQARRSLLIDGLIPRDGSGVRAAIAQLRGTCDAHCLLGVFESEGSSGSRFLMGTRYLTRAQLTPMELSQVQTFGNLDRPRW